MEQKKKHQEKEQGRRVGIWGRYGKKELELSTRSKDVKAIIVSTYFNKGTKESETNYSSRFNKIASYTNKKHNYSYGIDLEQRIIWQCIFIAYIWPRGI